MKKFVINNCFGGFELSDEANKMLNGFTVDQYGYNDYSMRSDSDLIEVVEKLGDKANGTYSELKVVEVPDNITDWMITDYDGLETLYVVENGKIVAY